MKPLGARSLAWSSSVAQQPQGRPPARRPERPRISQHGCAAEHKNKTPDTITESLPHSALWPGARVIEVAPSFGVLLRLGQSKRRGAFVWASGASVRIRSLGYARGIFVFRPSDAGRELSSSLGFAAVAAARSRALARLRLAYFHSLLGWHQEPWSTKIRLGRGARTQMGPRGRPPALRPERPRAQRKSQTNRVEKLRSTNIKW